MNISGARVTLQEPCGASSVRWEIAHVFGEILAKLVKYADSTLSVGACYSGHLDDGLPISVPLPDTPQADWNSMSAGPAGVSVYG